MTLQEYWRIIRTRGWIILVSMLLAAALAFGISYLQKELYQATVEVSTVPARPDWGLGNTAKDLMRNFTANLKTPEVAARVIARQQLDKNPYDLLADTQVEPDSSTFTIKIQVRDADGEVAKLAALGFADEFYEERTAYYAQQDKGDRIEVKIRSRDIGYAQIQPKPTLNAIAGAVLGLLFGLGLVLLLTWLEADLLRTPAAVERTLGLPVLGAVPQEGKAREQAKASAQPGRMPAPKTA
jgi:capsular polysaccharide biosynthesis protein